MPYLHLLSFTALVAIAVTCVVTFDRRDWLWLAKWLAIGVSLLALAGCLTRAA